ncbi:MAG TPA: hypothetical protein VFE25_03450, partial [Opitutaceae bacterium]|nr:hypothetical protein [Opitutaceae bacterium]
MSENREITPADFQLESLEPRLLLSGVTWAGAATGGDWNTASNWSGGAVPTFSDNVIIQGLNAGAQVTLSGTVGTSASVNNLEIDSGSLVITGVSLFSGSVSINGAGTNVTVNGSGRINPQGLSVSAGATLVITDAAVNVSASAPLVNSGSITVNGSGVLSLFGGGSQSAGATITIQNTGAFNVDVNTFESTDSSIVLQDNSTLGVNDADLKLDDTAAPTVAALHASGSSVITADGGFLLVNSSVVMDGMSQLMVIDQGGIEFNPSNQASGFGSINAVGSDPVSGGVHENAIFLDSGTFLLGTGYISALNAKIAGTIQPTQNFQNTPTSKGVLELSIADNLDLSGATLDMGIYSANHTDTVLLTDPLSGVGTYTANVSGLTIQLTAFNGYQPAQFVGVFFYVLNVENLGEVVTGNIAAINTLIGSIPNSGYGFMGSATYALQPSVILSNPGSPQGIFYGYPTAIGLNTTYTYTGPPGGDWNTASNWTVKAATDGSAVFTGTSPTIDSNVIIPGGLSSGPVFSGNYLQISSLVDGSGLSITSGALSVVGHGFITYTDGKPMPYIRSSIAGTLSISGNGMFETDTSTFLDDIGMTFGSIVATGSGRFVGFGAINLSGANSFSSGGLQIGGGSIVSLLSGASITSASAIVIPQFVTLYDSGTITAPNLELEGNLYVASFVVTDNSVQVSAATINGNLQVDNSGVLGLYILGVSAAQASQLTVNGVVIEGGTINIGYDSQYDNHVDQSYVMVTASGGFTNGFGSTALGNDINIVQNAGDIEADVLLNSSSNAETQNGLSLLQGYLQDAVNYFNLATINYSGQGLTALNLPVATNALATLFNLPNVVSGFSLPTIASAGSAQDLYNVLTAAGYTFGAGDGIGSTGGEYGPSSNVFVGAAPNGGQLQAEYDAVLASGLAPAGGFAGEQFNPATLGLLAGLVTGDPLAATMTWSASLSLHLVFGVDGGGNFYISDASAFNLTLTGSGLLGATTTVAGVANTVLSGSDTVSLSVLLQFGATGTRTLGDLAGNLASIVRPVANGTAGVNLSFTVGPAALNYASSYSVTSNSVVQTATLGGTLTIPGLTTSGGAALPLSLTGTYSSGTWTLLTTTSANNSRLGGNLVLSAAFTITMTPTSFTGTSTGFNYEQDFILGNSGATFVFQLQTAITATSATMTATVVLQTSELISTAGHYIVSTGATTVSINLNLNFATQAVTGTISYASGNGTFAPNASYSSAISDGNSDGTAVSVSYDIPSKVFTIAVDTLTVTVPYLFSFAVTNETFTYDQKISSGTEQLFANIPSQSVTLLAFNQATGPPHPSITTPVSIEQDGFIIGSATPVTLTNVLIGTAIKLPSVTVTLSNTSFIQNTTPVGTLSFAPTTANLYPSVTAVIGLATSLTGSVSLTSTVWNLSAASISVTVGEAFTATKSGVTFTYDLSQNNEQVLGSASAALVTSPTIGLLNASTSDLTFKDSGMDFTNFTLSPTSGNIGTIGSFLSITAPALNVSAFGFDTNSTNPFFGAAAFSLGGIAIYPAAPVFTVTPTGLAAGFNFSGSNPNGAFTITMAHFTFKLGSALQVDADNVVITPDQQTIVSIPTATLSSSLLSNMTGTLTNFVVTQTGFSIGSAVLATPVGQTSTLRVPTKPIRIATLTTAALTISGLGYDTTNGLSGTITFTAHQISLFPDSTIFTATGTNVSGGYVVNSAGVSVLTFSIQSVTVQFGSFLTLHGTNITITPEASTVASFGSLTGTLTMASTSIGATGGNFAVMDDGTFVTLPGFGVALNLSTSASSLLFPSWLPISITSLGLSWSNFSTDPEDFTIVLGASVTGINGLSGFSVSGTVTGLVIDPSLLAQGKLPITDVGTFSVNVTGSMFGAQVSGSLAGGVMKIDAFGNIISPFDTTTAVASSVFYGAIRVSATFSGISGFAISIGLSSLGPLSVYVGSTTNILLDPETGLTLINLGASVQFNTSLPSITNPLSLRDTQFTTSANLSDAQWVAQLQNALLAQVRTPPTGNFWSAFSQTMLIEGSATMISQDVGQNSLRSTVNILVSTDGKFAATGQLVIGNTTNLTLALYADLSQTGHIQFLFLNDTPGPPASPTMTIYGSLTINYPGDNTFSFTLNGGVMFTKAGVTVNVQGTLTMSFNLTQQIIELDITGSVSLPLIGNALGVNGVFFLQNYSNGLPFMFWGAMSMSPNLAILQNLGITATGTEEFHVNSASGVETVTLNVPGQAPETVHLAANDLSVSTSGALAFSNAGVQWFQITGQLTEEISSSGLMITAGGVLTVGNPNSPILSFNSTGFVDVTSSGIAAQLSLSLVPAIPQIAQTVLTGTFLLQINTTGAAVSYTVAGLTMVVPAGLPGGTAGPYAAISGNATLAVLNSITIQGAFSMAIGNGQLLATVTNGTTALSVNGTNLFNFTFSGGLLITSAGVAATINLNLAIGNGNNASSFGFNYSGTFALQLNTTGAAVASLALPAGPFVNIISTANITLSGNTGFSLSGTFTFTATATQVTVALATGIVSFKVGGAQVLQLSVAGGFTIVNQSSSDEGIALDLAVSLTTNVSSLGFSLSGTFIFSLNTTGTTQTIAGQTIAAGSVQVGVTGATLTIDGVALHGSLVITATSTSVSIAVTASFSITSGGISLFSFSTSGSLTLSTSGIVGTMTVSLTAQGTSSTGVTLAGSFSLIINTTTTAAFLSPANSIQVLGTGTVSFLGVAVTGTVGVEVIGLTSPIVQVSMAGSMNVGIGGTNYFSLSVNGGMQISNKGIAGDLSVSISVLSANSLIGISGTATLLVNTTGSAATIGGVAIRGGPAFIEVDFFGTVTVGGYPIFGAVVSIVLTSNSLVLSVLGTMSLTVQGSNLFSFGVHGTLAMTSSGIYGALSLTSAIVLPSIGLNLNFNFIFELNTTSTQQVVSAQDSNGVVATYVLNAGPLYVGLLATGSINIGGFSISGSFRFFLNSNNVTVDFSGSVNVFGSSLTISGDIGIYTDGVSLSASLGVQTISNSIFSLSGNLLLQLNSRSESFGLIAPHTYQVGVLAATINIAGIRASGTFVIGYSNGSFFMTIPSNSPLYFNFLGYGSVAVSGTVNSNGTFSLTGSMNIAVGRQDYVAISGHVAVTLSNSGASGQFSGSLFIFNSNVAQVTGSISSAGFSVSASVAITVPGINLTLSGTASFGINSGDVLGQFSLKGRLFGGVNASALLTFDTASNFYSVSATFSVSVGGSDLGASISGTVNVASDASKDGISVSGSAWAGFYIYNPFGSDWWVGASINISASGDFSGNFAFSLSVHGIGFTVHINVSSIVQALGSDISGGYAFLDMDGTGIWNPNEPRVPVGADGSFTFNVGDPSLWAKNAAGGYAFDDLNGNGVWDPATEARMPLVNGQLPSVLSVQTSNGAGAALGLLQAYAVTASNGTTTLDTTHGQVLAIGGQNLDPTTGFVTTNTSTIQLGGVTAGYTGLVGAGQTVFFDANGNGVLDSGEVAVQADSRGYFTFNPGQQQLAALGILGGFDTNGNGHIDPSEGSIVIAGAVDKNNGQPVNTIIRISATNLGSGLALTAQPLAALENVLVQRGFTPAAIDTRLSLVFGLPSGISFSTIDPQTGAGLTPTETMQILVLTNQLESFILNTTALLVSSGVSAGVAQTDAFAALADRVVQNYSPVTQSSIAPADMLDFTNLAAVTGMLNGAESKAGVSPATATTNAVAQVTVALNLAASAYAASSSDLARDLSRISSVLEGAIATGIGELGANVVMPAAFISSYTGAALDTLLANVALTPLTPPTVTGVSNVTVSPGDAPATLAIALATTTGISDNITLTATSSNTSFLPNSSISVVGSGANRYVVVAAGTQLGSATITVTATIDGVSTVETFTYTVAPAAPSGPQIVTTAPALAQP